MDKTNEKIIALFRNIRDLGPIIERHIHQLEAANALLSIEGGDTSSGAAGGGEAAGEEAARGSDEAATGSEATGGEATGGGEAIDAGEATGGGDEAAGGEAVGAAADREIFMKAVPGATMRIDEGDPEGPYDNNSRSEWYYVTGMDISEEKKKEWKRTLAKVGSTIPLADKEQRERVKRVILGSENIKLTIRERKKVGNTWAPFPVFQGLMAKTTRRARAYINFDRPRVTKSRTFLLLTRKNRRHPSNLQCRINPFYMSVFDDLDEKEK
jgi:hypothetical protein